MTKLVCKKCGSEDVAVMVWQNPNTKEITGPADEVGRAWCDDCQKFTKLIEAEK